MTTPPSGEGKFVGLIHAVKGMTLSNVLVAALMALVACGVYVVWTVMRDPAVLDRFLSSYTEYTDPASGCTVRTARMRGGPWRWSITTGFALSGADRYQIAVILDNEPQAPEAIASYCATLGLIVDRLQQGGNDAR